MQGCNAKYTDDGPADRRHCAAPKLRPAIAAPSTIFTPLSDPTISTAGAWVRGILRRGGYILEDVLHVLHDTV